MPRYKSLDPNKFILIRNAAIELFYEQGIDNTSISQIAAKAGIAKGTIYLYFKDREELVANIFNYCFEMHMKASVKDVELHTSCSDKLKKRVKNILQWNIDFPKESSIISTYYSPVNISGTENVSFAKSYEANKALIEDGVKNGEFKVLPVEFLCSIFFS